MHLFTTPAIRDETLRVCFDIQGKAGTYGPRLLLFRKGRNGSPAGVGPKGSRIVTIPHLTFARAYHWRRIGGLHAYRVESAFFWAIWKALK